MKQKMMGMLPNFGNQMPGMNFHPGFGMHMYQGNQGKMGMPMMHPHMNPYFFAQQGNPMFRGGPMMPV